MIGAWICALLLDDKCY